MGSEAEGEYVFVCPECDESLEVNARMKETLIEKGCVICGADVTDAAFTRASESDSP